MSDAAANDAPRLWAVAAGGAVGTAARAGLVGWLPAPEGAFPVAVFAANVAGALVLGGLAGLWERRAPGHAWLAPFFAIGLLGSFTTFSTLALDLAALAPARPWLAAGTAFASLLAGMAAAALGWSLARRGASG